MNKTQIIALLLFTLMFKVYSQSEFKNEETTIFKDGTVFFEKSGLFYPQNGVINIKKLPFEINKNSYRANRVVLGSLWFSCPNNKISEIKFLNDTIKGEKYETTTQLLHYNIGKFVKLKTINSNIVQSGYVEKVFSNRTADFLLLKNTNSITQIDINKITSINFDAPNYTNKTPKTKRVALVKLNTPKTKQKVNVSYLQKGITWMPNYFIELFDEKNGKIELEAAIINDIEDINNSDINLAVGIPVFSYVNSTSPFTTKENALNVLDKISNAQIRSGIMTNFMSQNIIHTPSTNETKSEGTGEDLFFYKCKDISIPKGGRSKVKIFDYKFKYENIYSVSLQSNENLYRGNRDSETQKNLVWHSIKFKNNMNLPLTTGTVFFYKRNKKELQLVSQNQLNYTPQNESTTVKTSIAPDIWIKNKDKEIERVNVKYDKLITSESNIEIINYKSKPIDIIVKRTITGDLINSDKNWTVDTKLEKGYYNNKVNYVSWKLTIPAGKKEIIKYKYKIMIN